MAKDIFENADVAVTVIHRDGRVLLVWNARWGGFTLPMTKRRSWKSMSRRTKMEFEPWDDAAMRNVGECLGCTSIAAPTLHLEIPKFTPSVRTGDVKRYHFQVFIVGASASDELAGCVVGEWLTVKEILDEKRRPISPTARYLIGECTNPDLAGSRGFPPKSPR